MVATQEVSIESRKSAQLRLAIDLVELLLSEGAGNLRGMPEANVSEFMTGLTLLMECVSEEHYGPTFCGFAVLSDFFEALTSRPDGEVLERMAWCMVNVFTNGMRLNRAQIRTKLTEYREKRFA